MHEIPVFYCKVASRCASRGSGQPTSLFSQFRTPHFRLLLFAGHTSTADVAESAQLGRQLRDVSGGLVRPCLIVSPQEARGGAADDLILLGDREQGTQTTYGASSPCLYLIRPDGYVGFRSRLADEASLIDYVRRNFARNSLS